jgi:hypothetical protein
MSTNEQEEVVDNATVGGLDVGGLSLRVAGTDIVHFAPNGEIFVRGEKVDDNKLVYEAFRLFLQDTTGLSVRAGAQPFAVHDRGKTLAIGAVSSDVPRQAVDFWQHMSAKAFNGDKVLSIFIRCGDITVTEDFKPLGYIQEIALEAGVDTPLKLLVTLPDIPSGTTLADGSPADENVIRCGRSVQATADAISEHGGAVIFRPASDHVIETNPEEQKQAESALLSALTARRADSSEVHEVFLEEVVARFQARFKNPHFLSDVRSGTRSVTVTLSGSDADDAAAETLSRILQDLASRFNRHVFFYTRHEADNTVRVVVEVGGYIL